MSAVISSSARSSEDFVPHAGRRDRASKADAQREKDDGNRVDRDEREAERVMTFPFLGTWIRFEARDVETPTGEGPLSRYFTDPKMALAHLLLHLPRNAAAPQRLQGLFGASQRRVSEILAKLRRCGFLRTKGGGRVSVLSVNARLPPTSPLFQAHRKLLREAHERVRKAPQEKVFQLTIDFFAWD